SVRIVNRHLLARKPVHGLDIHDRQHDDIVPTAEQTVGMLTNDGHATRDRTARHNVSDFQFFIICGDYLRGHGNLIMGKNLRILFRIEAVALTRFSLASMRLEGDAAVYRGCRPFWISLIRFSKLRLAHSNSWTLAWPEAAIFARSSSL